MQFIFKCCRNPWFLNELLDNIVIRERVMLTADTTFTQSLLTRSLTIVVSLRTLSRSQHG